MEATVSTWNVCMAVRSCGSATCIIRQYVQVVVTLSTNTSLGVHGLIIMPLTLSILLALYKLQMLKWIKPGKTNGNWLRKDIITFMSSVCSCVQ
jgi:hypothetical protein